MMCDLFASTYQILATGQLIRFSFSILAGVIQAFLLNGPSTNSSTCEIAWDACWSWGLTSNFENSYSNLKISSYVF